MAFDKAEKARRRALKAGPYPKPRGRVPRGSNGVKQRWDNERGGWQDVAAPAWSSTLDFPELGAVVALAAAANPADAVVAAPAVPIAAAPAVTWDAPTIWQLEDERSEKRTVSNAHARLHEHVQLTPRGSRAHTFEHISPGGTTRLEQYTSPAVARAMREERAGCRTRIAQARVEGRVRCYWTACMHCGTSRRIKPDGCMPPHSIGPSLNARERAAYRESEAYAEHGWECPGSHEYYGPCESASEEESDED